MTLWRRIIAGWTHQYTAAAVAAALVAVALAVGLPLVAGGTKTNSHHVATAGGPPPSTTIPGGSTTSTSAPATAVADQASTTTTQPLTAVGAGAPWSTSTTQPSAGSGQQQTATTSPTGATTTTTVPTPAAQAGWTRLNGTSPPSTAGPSMAYDGSEGVLVAGSSTWLWNGSWKKGPSAGRTARSYAAMAYDPAAGDVVLFGGQDAQQAPLQDTLIWDGQSWTTGATTGPPARAFAAMAYDSNTQQLVLFGGYDPTTRTDLSDTWTWDSSHGWQARPAAGGPPALQGASMATDPTTGHPILFGGQDANGQPSAQTWTWTGTGWQQLHPASSPPARSGAALAPDRTNPASVVLFGGRDVKGNSLGDTWLWNGQTWTQETGSQAPPASSYAIMTWDGKTAQDLYFGGGTTWVWGKLTTN